MIIIVPPVPNELIYNIGQLLAIISQHMNTPYMVRSQDW